MCFISNNVPDNKSLNDDHCLIFSLVNQTRLRFPSTSILSIQAFELLHTDKGTSICGAHYFVIIVDDYIWCMGLSNKIYKSDTRSLLQSFVQLIETQFSTTKKTIWTYDRPEFDISSYYSTIGIVYQIKHVLSCDSTSQ